MNLPRDPNENEPKRVVRSFYRSYGPYLTLGFQLAAGVLFFYFIGRWVDSRYDTTPVFMLVGIVIGTVGGLIKFFMTVINLSNKDDAPRA
jgi:F0F1-type ATP synthase assembly protein I